MATGEIDFSSTAVGQAPAGMTSVWQAAPGDFTVNAAGNLIWTGGIGWDGFTYDAAPDSPSYEVLTKLRIFGGLGDQHNHGVVLLATANAGYYVTVRGSRNQLDLYRFTGSGEVLVASVAAPNDVGAEVWVRARVGAAGVLQARSWLDGSPEPTSWMIDTVDTTYTTGKFGVFGRDNRSNSVEWSYFSFGTGADAAPAPGVVATAPTNIIGGVSNGQAVISWDAVANADGYSVEFRRKAP